MHSRDLTSQNVTHHVMDATVIKALLDSHERAYKTAPDEVVKQTSERINKLESTVADLKTNLEYTQ